MGEVYRARDTRLGRLVAIKFVSEEFASDRTSADRLEREARLTSLLNHPNIVTVHDVGELDGRPFIVMEFVAGQSLHAALLQGRFKPTRVIDIAGQVADGLAAAHAAGVVHRDLKPRNIMLTEDGRAKIVDFGIGKTNQPVPGADDPTMEAGSSDTLKAAGTPGYMSPEQAAGRLIDFRTDQFALGAIVLRNDHGPPRLQAKLGRANDGRDHRGRAGAYRGALAGDAGRAADGRRAMPGQRSGASLCIDTRPRARSARSPARRPDRARRAPGCPAGRRGVDRPGSRQPSRSSSWRPRLRCSSGISRMRRWRRRARCSTGTTSRRTWIRRSRSSRRFRRPAAILWHTLCWPRRTWRKFDSTKDATFADRAGNEAGLALASNQSYAPAHVVLAMMNYGQGRFDGALGEAQRAVSLDAKNGRAWRELGRVHARLGQRDDAEKELRTAVALAPDDWTVHNSLGSLYLNLNRFDEAVSEFERMQALTPDNIRVYNNLGTAYFNQDRFDKAIEMYERSLSLDRNTTAYSNLGTALYQQGQYADAARSFEGAVALPGAGFLHWFNLGAACYWVPEMRGRAKEAYERAVALGEEARAATPKDLSLLTELASGYAVLALLTPGPAAEAPRQHARRILELVEAQQPRDASVLSTLATTYEELGDRQKALDTLGEALHAGYSIKTIERSPWLKELRSDERYARVKK